MPSSCGTIFFYFSKFDIVTDVTGCQRLTPLRTEFKYLLKDAALNSLHDRICPKNSRGGLTRGAGGGGKSILSHQSNIRLN